MSKYTKATSHLASSATRWVRAIQWIEAILGYPLPKVLTLILLGGPIKPTTGIRKAASWQSIGWRTAELNLANQQVTFFCQEPDQDRPRATRVTSPKSHNDGLTIAEAKAGLSIHFGVAPESVVITIKG